MWTQKNGTKASSTGTIYGIYDLSGGAWERTAGLIANGNDNLINHGNSLLNNRKNNSTNTKYVTVYPSSDSEISDSSTASKINYEKNTKIYGDAIRETSTEEKEQNSWFSDYSYFVGASGTFFKRGGGGLWDCSGAGLFAFNR